MIEYNMIDLTSGKVDPSCGIQVGDYVQRRGYSSGIYVVDKLHPMVYDYDYWLKHGSSKWMQSMYEPDCAYVMSKPNINWQPCFCRLDMRKIANGTFRLLKAKKKPTNNYLKANDVRKIDKAIFQAELQAQLDDIKKRYTDIINFLP